MLCARRCPQLMKNERIILDNYLHGYQKFIVFYLLIITLFGCLNFLLKPNDLTDFLVGLLLLIISYVLLVAMIGKKGLLISNGNFFRGITFSGKFLLKERIDIEKYAEFTHKRKQKTDLPWIFEYSGLGIFSNHHECSVYL